MRILPTIHAPSDLKKIPNTELPELCQEIRDEILEVTSRNGGHLAPNLGVVELTVALHKVFSMPRDKIVWDVGHQSYVHKLLTGRLEQFPTLRQYGGLCGFPKRQIRLFRHRARQYVHRSSTGHCLCPGPGRR